MIKRLLFCLLFPVTLWSQVTVAPLVMPRKQFLDQAGNPLPGGHVCTYTVGTTTPQVTYTDYTATVPNGVCDPDPANPPSPPPSDGILLDAGGWASVYVKCADSPYKVVVYDKNWALIWSEDGVQYPGCGTPPPSTCPTGTCPEGQFVVAFDGECGVICAAGEPGPPGPSITCDPTKVVELYVDPAGNDTTGDGSIGNPWLTVQKAWDDGVPYAIDGTYNINLKTAGTYTGAINLTNKFFPSGGINYASCGVSAPCSLVRIKGDSSAPENYILELDGTPGGGGNLIFVGNGQSVSLQYLSIENASYGLTVIGDSKVTLGGVQFKNNTANVEVTDAAFVFSETGTYLTDGFTNIGITSDGGFNPTTGVAVNANGVFTDWCTNYFGDITTTNYFSCDMPGSNITRCAEVIGGTFTWTGIVNAIRNYFFGESGTFNIAALTFDGGSNNHIAVVLDNTSFTGAFSGGSNYSISNITTGVSIRGGSVIDLPSFVSVTTPIIGPQFLGNAVISAMGQQLAFATLPQAVTGSTATTTLDPSIGQIIKVTVTADTQITSGGAVNPGEFMYLQLCQDGVGSHTITFDATFLGAGTPPSTADTCTSQTFRWSVPDSAWVAAGAVTSEY